MKVLTEWQVNKINALILQIEKESNKQKIISLVEGIREVLSQAEQVTLKLEH